jgi:hypothetical protein
VNDPAPIAPDPTTFLSGDHGSVVGPRLIVRRTLADAAQRAAAALALHGPRLDRLAAAQPPRRVLVLSVYRPGSLLPAALENLESQRHDVRFSLGSMEDEDLKGGKFENLNRLLERTPAAVAEHDWVLVVDDDVALPRRFTDRFVALAERLGLDLAQPAQTMRSHAAWRVTRRRALALARRTSYVEIGPVTGFAARAAAELLPFPPLRFGWGLDNHWGALARERGWRLGVLDSLAVRHETQRVATAYDHAEAIAEAQKFLTGRSYVTAAEAQQTLATVRRVPA